MSETGWFQNKRCAKKDISIMQTSTEYTFYKFRQQVSDIPEMTLDEINAEIPTVSKQKNMICYIVIDANVWITIIEKNCVTI